MKMWITLAIIAVANMGFGWSLCTCSESDCAQFVYGRVFPLILGYELFILLLAWSNAKQVRSSVR